MEAVASQNHGIQEITPLTPSEVAQETVMMGLRLAEGIKLNKHLLTHMNPTAITKFQNNGMMTIENDQMKLNFEGRKVLNYILGQLI